MDILELLEHRGLDMSSRVKFVRHMDEEIEEYCRDGYIEVYQSYQSKPIFECDYIVSFIGQAGSKARFYGVFQVLGREQAKEADAFLNSKFVTPKLAENDVFYSLKEIDGFDDLKHRVVIDWGKSGLAWHQWMIEKEVIEILPKGYVRPFPGYLDFTLRFDELKDIFRFPDANREWNLMLSRVAGVYLITDLNSGSQYVGSAYGRSGILGRWSNYASNGHGDNIKLIDLLKDDQDYARNFQFTILRTLSSSLTNKEVIEYEGLYKKKLGTRVFGLNSN